MTQIALTPVHPLTLPGLDPGIRIGLGVASPTLRNPLPHWGRGKGEGDSKRTKR